MMRFAAYLLVILFYTSAFAQADEPPTEEQVYQQGIDLLTAGKQSDAEKLIFAQCRANPTAKMCFFAGVLVRSRFEVPEADRIFAEVIKMAPDTLAGKTAKQVVLIDEQDDTEDNFKGLDDLSTHNPKDPLVLWMVAVECRQLHRAETGLERYAQLLKIFNPGPALLHQTYGNLLLEAKKPVEALAQYDIAIAMEPAPWDYNCRANALMALKRFDEATAAYRTATELDPNYLYAWQNWALLCDKQNDPAGAAEKRAKAADIIARRNQRRDAGAK